MRNLHLTRLVKATAFLMAALALPACTSSGETPSDDVSSGQPSATEDPPKVEGSLLFADAGDISVYEGTTAKKLTSTPAVEANPFWSPDGSRILFSRRDERGSDDLFTMSSDGTDEERLTSTPRNEGDAAWSPDGTKIVYSTFTEGEGSVVWVMNADGTKPHQIYADPTAFVGVSDWSPDGRSLLLGVDKGGGGQIDTYVIGVDGTGFTQLTKMDGDDSGGKWRPDGEQIVFWSDGNPKGPGIYLMQSDGSQQTKIFDDPLGADTMAFAWSPDAEQIAWTAKFEGGLGSAIFLMRPDGTHQQQLSDDLQERTSLDWKE